MSTAGRIVLLVTSPRLPAGLLTATAWDLLRAHPVFTAAGGDQVRALRSAGVTVSVVEPDPEALIAALASDPTVIWLGGATGDEDFARRLGLRLAREPALAELELCYGSWDPPGARLLDAVAVMDRLASPGGDVVDRPRFGGVLLCQPRVEGDLQEHVAELLAQVDQVAVLDRLVGLVRLLEQVGLEAVVGLLRVPRAAAR